MDMYRREDGVQSCCNCGSPVVKQGESILIQAFPKDECGNVIINLDTYAIRVLIRNTYSVFLMFEVGADDAPVTSTADKDGQIEFILPGSLTKDMKPDDYFMTIRIGKDGLEIESRIQELFTVVRSDMGYIL